MESFTHSSQDRFRQWANLLAILAAFALNIYANLAPPKGLTIGEISQQFFNSVLVIPANYAFAIWGVIYLGLISFGIYQVLREQKSNRRLRRGGYFLVIASLAQIVWVFLFLYRFFALSVLAMLVILISLILFYLKIGVGKERVSQQEAWLVQIPISIYLGWISVATIVNIASALDFAGWNGWGISPEIWTLIMLVVAAGIAALVNFQRRDIAFPIVFIWAFVAIAVRRLSLLPVAVPAVILALALAGFIIFNAFRRPRYRSFF
jgi:hypothetical protein